MSNLQDHEQPDVVATGDQAEDITAGLSKCGGLIFVGLSNNTDSMTGFLSLAGAEALVRGLNGAIDCLRKKGLH